MHDRERKRSRRRSVRLRAEQLLTRGLPMMQAAAPERSSLSEKKRPDASLQFPK